MEQYLSGLLATPYSEILTFYPNLQSSVYDQLVEMTPERLRFELSIIKPSNVFNLNALDQPTFGTLYYILSNLLDKANPALTDDDVIIAYSRFRELLLIYSAIENDVMGCEVTEDGQRYFYTGKSEERRFKAVPVKHYRAKLV